MGIGGSSAKTDRNQTLASYQNLNSLFNFGLNTGQNATSAGNSSIGQAGNYYSSILSGNRSAMQQAIAPETNSILSSGDAARRQQAASGTARGGGTAGANQQQQTNQQSQIDNALFAARPAAAQGQTQVGGMQLNEASNALGQAGNAAGANLDASIKSRGLSQQINQQTQQEVSGALDAALAAFV